MNRIFVICASLILLLVTATLSQPQVHGAIIYDWKTTNGPPGATSTLTLDDNAWNDNQVSILEIISWTWTMPNQISFNEQDFLPTINNPIPLGPKNLQIQWNAIQTKGWTLVQNSTLYAPWTVNTLYVDTYIAEPWVIGFSGNPFKLTRGQYTRRTPYVHPAPIPEPGTIALFGIGLLGMAGAKVRSRRKKKPEDISKVIISQN